MIEFSGGSRPRIASDETLLPDPDSPTSATVELRGMSNEMPRTASNVSLPPRRNATRRLRMLTSGSPGDWTNVVISMPLQALELRVECVAQRIGEQAERGDEERHRRRRRDELPPLAEDQLVLRLVQ